MEKSESVRQEKRTLQENRVTESRTQNGERQVTFALKNNSIFKLNTFYKKQKLKKWTWISPNGLYKNKIDFLLKNNKKNNTLKYGDKTH